MLTELSAASFRIILTPIDTVKTTLQAQGPRGTALLRQRIKTNGIGSLWWGALATAAATFAGNYPWFATYNLLTELLPEPARHPLAVWLLRLAFIGFVASVVSDSVSNSLRVVKTYRQVNDTKVSYGRLSPVSLSRSLTLLKKLLLTKNSRGCLAGRARGRHCRPVWARPQDAHPLQRPAGSLVFHPVETLP